MLQKQKKIIAFLSTIAALIHQGCATVGTPFEFKGPQSLKVGKTTKSEVTALYGRPFRVGYENGKNKWTYGYYKYQVFGTNETKDLTITFDPEGIVRDYAYNSSDSQEVDNALMH